MTSIQSSRSNKLDLSIGPDGREKVLLNGKIIFLDYVFK